MFWPLFQIFKRKEIIDCLILGQAHQKYTESIREFALTLHFHSPRAYEYVRNTSTNIADLSFRID